MTNRDVREDLRTLESVAFEDWQSSDADYDRGYLDGIRAASTIVERLAPDIEEEIDWREATGRIAGLLALSTFDARQAHEKTRNLRDHVAAVERENLQTAETLGCADGYRKSLRTLSGG